MLTYSQIQMASATMSPTFHCIGTLPANATLYPGDNVTLTEDAPIVFSEADTPAKCEYTVATQG
jgi:hypothetical protein